MRCAACGAINDQGRVYCGGCAHRLGGACPVCQFLNGEGVRYCGGCARDLLVAVAEPAPPAVLIPVPALAAVPDTARPHPTRAPASIFDDLGDLLSVPVPVLVAAGETPLPAVADVTQSEIDGFFGRLVREGVAKIDSPGTAGQSPGPPRGAPS